MPKSSGNNVWHDPRGGVLTHAAEGFSLRTGSASRPKATMDPYDPPPFCEEEVVHWLEFIKNDYWYQTQMPITPAALGAAIGRESVLVTRGPAKPLYPKIIDRISRVIPDIERRRLIFPEPVKEYLRNDEQLDMFGRKPGPKFIWTDPPEKPFTLNRYAPLQYWTMFHACASCSGNQWLPLTLAEKPYVACYRCMPPAQYRSINGRAQKNSLIHTAALAYY